MEQTLGKRIMEHRKRMGLTQDQLAEQLGITAQAVSKWENDLSCPDIATLPKLADIFGITTDELLGKPPKAKVYEAEVVDDDNGADNGLHVQKGNWEFKWDGGKRGALGFACWVLGMGVLLLVNNLFHLNAGFWSLAWPSWLLMMGLFGGKKFSFTRLGFVLLGSYFLVNNLGIMPFELGGEIIWPGLVILFGLSLLVDALRKPKKPVFHIRKHDSNSNKTKCDCRNSKDSFQCDLSFGENTHIVELPVLSRGEANCSFGELVVDLSGCEAVAEDCYIEANCSFGELVLLVPRRFVVNANNSTAFATVNFSGHPDSTPTGVIRLEANASFGEVSVKYI